jgi:hypothetical protein
MHDDNSKPSARGTALANGVIGAGRVAYADAGRAYRYSCVLLHRELSEEEAAARDVPRRASRLAVAVHGAIAGAMLGSWSKTADVVRYPLHRVADVLGLDPFADGGGEASPEGNGAAGRKVRFRIQQAAEELNARGALIVEWRRDRYGKLLGAFALPEPPQGWADPTYVQVAESELELETLLGASRDVPPADREGRATFVPCSDETETVEPERVQDEGTYRLTWQRLQDDSTPSGPPAPVDEPGTERSASEQLGTERSNVAGLGTERSRFGNGAFPVWERGVPDLGTTNEKQDEKQDEQTDETRTNAPTSVRPSVDEHEQQEQPRGGAGGIPPGPERSAGKGGNGSGIPRAERQHVEALAAALPERVARSHPHSREHLAAAMLGHGAEQHRSTLDKLRRYLELGATAEVAGHLAAAAARWNGEARSLAGFVLTWLGDLPPEPRYRPEEYRYGFPLRDAMKTCGLAGDWGLLRASTFAMAAEAVLHGGHDPERDADGFAAALAATVLQLVEPDEDETGEPSTAALARLAGDARPVPFVLPPEPPHEGPPRGVAALRMLGLGYPDARTSKQSGTERHRIPGMSGGVWR